MSIFIKFTCGLEGDYNLFMEKFYETLIFSRIKNILKNKNLATYKLQKNDIIQRLNNFFWDNSRGINGFWNKRIYKNQVDFLKNAIKNKGHNIESCHNNLADNLNIRTDELITHLINQDMLRSDNDTPPSYFINTSIWSFLGFLKWLIVKVIFFGLIVSIIANIISNYLWEVIKN